MSLAAFNKGLYVEHFEELACLYESRDVRLDDGESTHEDLAELEARMEAHIDGLVLGGEAALEAAIAEATVDDAPSFYALVCLACRTQRYELLQTSLEQLETYCADDDTKPHSAAAIRRAVAHALRHQLPSSWLGPITDALGQASAHVTPVLAAAVGSRWATAPCAAQALADAATRPCADLAPLLETTARVAAASPRFLHEQLGHRDPRVATLAAVSALRHKDGAGVIAHALHERVASPWAAIPLAMCAGPSLCEALVAATQRTPTPQRLLALGILGDMRGLDVLRSNLANRAQSEFAEVAALAMFLLTGATFEGAAAPAGAQFEEEKEEDTDTDDDDTDDPPLAWLARSGATFSTDPNAWTQWLKEHAGDLEAGVRYRLGVPADPSTELAALTSSKLPLQLRRLLADEFVIRYGLDLGVEVDMLAVHQAQAMAWTRSRLQQTLFASGVWYFGGQVAR